jgi:hypothetical protein
MSSTVAPKGSFSNETKEYVSFLLSDALPKWLLDIVLKDDYIEMFEKVFDFNQCLVFRTVSTALTEDLITWYMQENKLIPQKNKLNSWKRSFNFLPRWPLSFEIAEQKNYVFPSIEDRVTKMRQYFEHILKNNIISKYKLDSFFKEKNKNKKYTEFRYVIELNDEKDLTKGSKTIMKEVDMEYDFEGEKHYIFDNFFECLNQVLYSIFLNSELGYPYIKNLFNKFLAGREILTFMSKGSFLSLLGNVKIPHRSDDDHKIMNDIYNKLSNKKREEYEKFFKANNIYIY